jgi:hypothetical protein
MTLEEMITMIGGVNDCSIQPLAQLELPHLLMSDGPPGVHDHSETTAYAAGIALGIRHSLENWLIIEKLPARYGQPSCKVRLCAGDVHANLNFYESFS